MRILTLNLLNNPRNWCDRYQLFADELPALNADVVALQEVLEIGLEELEVIMLDCGYEYSFSVLEEFVTVDDVKYVCGNATFSKFPIVESHSVDYREYEHMSLAYRSGVLPSVVTVIEVEGKRLCVVNNHLAWSYQNELYRKQQLEVAVHFVEDTVLADVYVMVGDFNTTENTDSIRYLRGETHGSHEDEFTYWVDAFIHRGEAEEYATTGPDLPFAVETALRIGIFKPEELPARRVDYIMVKGWAYGRLGSPLNCHRLDTRGFSDHYGVYSDLLF